VLVVHVCVVGTGYVGLVTGSCLAEMGNRVSCIDIDAGKIEKLQQGIIPIYEPGLEEIVKRNVKEKRLTFSTRLADGLNGALFCFITVGTPPSEDGSADLSHVLAVTHEIGRSLDHYLIVINKSTVPVGTAKIVREAITAELQMRGLEIEFDVVSNPEFLKEGAAIEDFLRPDRIVIGTDNVRTTELMKQLYEPFVRNQHPILTMDIASAELTKYAANAMLAMRISFMNEFARLCDQVGADISQIRVGIGSDQRIGMSFLYAGPGYGGSCFPKDVKELANTGERFGSTMHLMQAIDAVNEAQKRYVPTLIVRRFGEHLSGRHFALWGLAFKPQTDDMREAPSLVLIEELLQRGAAITAYDPIAMEQAQKLLGERERLFYADDMMEMLDNKDALILMTEWRQFRQPDLAEVKQKMKFPVIFDGRNIYDHAKLHAMGLQHYCIGRGCVPQHRMQGAAKCSSGF